MHRRTNPPTHAAAKMAKSEDPNPNEAPDKHVSGQSNRPLSRPAHALTHEQLAAELEADVLSGLTTQEATARLEQYGANDLGEEDGVQPLKIVLAQIANAMTMVRLDSRGWRLHGHGLTNWREIGSHPGHGRQLWHRVVD